MLLGRSKNYKLSQHVLVEFIADKYEPYQHPDASTIKFLNRLDCLDELTIICGEWKPNVPEVKPKFMWKKLELLIPPDCGQMSRIAQSNMIAIGQASSTNGEAHITFSADRFDNPQSGQFQIEFLNKCNKIETLKVL